MDWRLKRLIRHALLGLPAGAKLYRWLTYQVLGSMGRMPAKWFRVFPSRIDVLRRLFGDEARSQRLWCFDSGATMAAGLAMAMATDAPGLLTDRWNRLCDRYCETSRRVLREKGPELGRLSGAAEDRVEWLLAQTENKKAVPSLRAIGMTYAGDHSAADRPEWRGRVGCVFSGGALEHYTPEELEQEVARMATSLQPDGAMSHVVDHRDHRWHADKVIGPLAHLMLEDEEYDRRFGSPLEYHNRWLRSHYVELFSRHGFGVEFETLRTYEPDMPPLDRSQLASRFRDADEEDLASLVTHFIARRR